MSTERQRGFSGAITFRTPCIGSSDRKYRSWDRCSCRCFQSHSRNHPFWYRCRKVEDDLRSLDF
ncbi:hypothetical protein BDW60DRAFT_185282 [Aspergillus nidulans var. acristatus]